VEKAFQLTHSHCSEGLWAIVNNAGINNGYLCEFTPIETHKQVMDVNYFGVVMMTLKFLPLLKKSKGRVINIASIAGQLGFPALGAYCASKFACEGFSDSLRREMNLFGVDVVLIEPGFTNTPIVQNSQIYVQEIWKNSAEELRLEYGGEKFFQRQLQLMSAFQKYCQEPSKVVNTLVGALFCKKPQHRYLSGYDCYFIWKPLIMLPTFISDQIFLFLS